jgi:CDP-diacylglycerol--glycerol-3-phosphate 3-phosphatidyltransferase
MNVDVAEPPTATDRVWTIPNLLSALRLAGVPVFLWLVLGPHANGWALLVLVYAGLSDYFDGRIARSFGQTSRLGTLLDPAADRLYILATVVALTVRGIVPWWLAGALLGRDLVLALTLPVLARHGYGPLQVNFVGKAATFALLYAFPLLLLSEGSGVVASITRPPAWAFTAWGAALYWWSGLLYLLQVRQVVAAAPAGRAAT